jgi:hypothetical protein
MVKVPLCTEFIDYKTSMTTYKDPLQTYCQTHDSVGAIGALMNVVRQPRTLLVRGRNAGMGADAGLSVMNIS